MPEIPSKETIEGRVTSLCQSLPFKETAIIAIIRQKKLRISWREHLNAAVQSETHGGR